ncbi:hypothetical protein GUJ93_ZPchr0001g30876 [Zizania palustris]|uniref:non-specific serine/threonine protein kinase n=1 Tax=Zizania palustris TaxID=103762 RepID=A0A8J5RY19_ZIZPA|nr:hypothetical protein GUJ93_ZPchr0001g30876 [Zizania palustris]
MMLLAKEFALSPPAAMASRRRAPARVSSWVFSPSGSAGGSPVGELWLRTRGGGGAGGTDGFGSHGHDSDMDLAMLVSDFLENGGSGGVDSRGSSDSESSLSDLAHLTDKISMYKQGGDEKQNELLSMVHSLLFSIHESELLAFKRGQCSGGCIRHLLVKLLRLLGYDAAICVSKWQGFDKIPGEYGQLMRKRTLPKRIRFSFRYAKRKGVVGLSASTSTSRVSAASVPRSEGEILQSANIRGFTFNELRVATRNFRPDSVVGEGGFSFIFKGWIDENTFAPYRLGTGMVIAVKKLNQDGFQGHREWLAKVNYLGQLSHPNLVKLVGYCLLDEQRLLVYEFMPRGSSENHLFRRAHISSHSLGI